MHMQHHNKSPVNIFGKHDTRFEDFMVQWSQSTNNYIEGIGCEVKHASVITEEEEDLLWITEVFGDQSPKALFCSIFFFNG